MMTTIPKRTSFSGFLVAALLLGCLTFLGACTKKVKKESEVYFNDFEGEDRQGISSGTVLEFSNSKVLGGFADGGFSLLLKNLPRHDLVTISFDLYIHDSWLGNHREVEDEFYPDLWSLSVDKELYVSTTFSNSPCVQQWFCPTQSYPKNYPNNNQAAFSGADKKDLPGLCSPKGISSLYKIKKTISHNQATLLLECLSALKLEDIEASGDCSASWSIDNLSIHTISLN